MQLIKDDTLAADPWASPADDEPLPAGEPAIVSLERWQAERESLIKRNAPLGVSLRSDQPPGEIAGDLGHFEVIALEFPKFTDGRAYSYARLLRERHGYAGELRAVGNVLRDQFPFMVRCGFDAFEVPDGARIEDWLASRDAISVSYQPAGNDRATISVLRQVGRDGNRADDVQPSSGRPAAGSSRGAAPDKAEARTAHRAY